MKIKSIFLSILALALPSVSYSSDANMLMSALTNGGSSGLAAMMCAINSKKLNSEDTITTHPVRNIETAHSACSRRTREASSTDFSLIKWATKFTVFTVKCRDGNLFLSKDEMDKLASNFEIVEIQGNHDEKYIYLPSIQKKTIEKLKELNFNVDDLTHFMIFDLELNEFLELLGELDCLMLNLGYLQRIVLDKIYQPGIDVYSFIERLNLPCHSGSYRFHANTSAYDTTEYSSKDYLILKVLLRKSGRARYISDIDKKVIYKNGKLLNLFSANAKKSLLFSYLKSCYYLELKKKLKSIGIKVGVPLAIVAAYFGRNQINQSIDYIGKDSSMLVLAAFNDMGDFQRHYFEIFRKENDLGIDLFLEAISILGLLPIFYIKHAPFHPIGAAYPFVVGWGIAQLLNHLEPGPD